MHAFLRSISFLWGFLLPLALFAQPDTLWTLRIYDSSGPYVVNPVIHGAAALTNGDFAVVGTVTLPDYTTDAFIGRVSSEGQLLWFHVFVSEYSNESGHAVVEQSNGNLIMAGGGMGSATSFYAVALWSLNANGDSLWTRLYTGAGQISANDLKLLAGDNLLIYGYRLGLDPTHSDAWLLKCTSYGDTLWTRLFGGADTDVGNCILIASENRYFLGGASKNVGNGDFDLWLLLSDSNGTQISQDAAGTTVTERCYDMCLTDSAIYVAGRTSMSSGSLADGYLSRATLNGFFSWSQPFNAGLGEEQFQGVTGLPDGSVRCVGWAGTSTTNVKPWITDISSSGVLQHSWVYSGFQWGQLYGIMPAAGGGYLTWGTINEGGVSKGLIMRIGAGSGISGVVTDTDFGLPQSGVRIGITGSSRYTVTNSFGQFYFDLLAGTYSVTVSGPCITADTLPSVTVFADSTTAVNPVVGIPDYHATRTSVNLVVQNHIPSGTPFVIYNIGSGAMIFAITADPRTPASNWLSTNPAQGSIPPHDSTIVQVEVSASEPVEGIYEYYGFMDIHTHSCPDSFHHIPVLATVLDAQDRTNGIPAEFALHPPYPNPFNAVTRLSFSLPRASNVRLTVYDIAGRAVRTLAEKSWGAGYHEVSFNAGDLPSGVYLVRMNSGSFTGTQKLLLLK